MKQISLDALNKHLFETIEMLKNNSDSKASPNEKIGLEEAKVIVGLGKAIVDGYKVKAQVLNILSKSENPTIVKSLIGGSGISEIKSIDEVI